ncbi:L-methionine (R)-S-oxide reductase [Dysgonomonas sp. PFB1-18]|uniref:GAF domain-containing protein n=1 Tax=unclassified Dysgonomonas TaxID=2630389 RepID=UPI002475BDC2|nr:MULTISPECIES: GAF domain-containing protein [unclassified Dysgonomonas]MDH6308296.1 L-methionine (R)-S-oxide reductase [Dysgonomonas sp. PF1-14]MDH6338266.1 L-methionine (R)-S-oxide reductase [Dysgonomonas sp. PF1-16]MDH6379763.1 L-methionine (R)-S-oxide reductase [Dysgonomonas sp. PFB1-18]MDH6397147.1 L-methionine (R)-S-oxide reductase [Dysgonomonas sp. PF1-23]
MAESLYIDTGASKAEKYESLLPQLKGLLTGETDTIANFANVSAALKQAFGFFWVGFYIVKHQELVLGPFQGTIACTRIKYGKGVCGTAWKEKRTVIVEDVNQFPGHIACDAASQSEIVVPLFVRDEVIAVLDVDSDHLNHFDQTDALYLQEIVKLLEAQY